MAGNFFGGHPLPKVPPPANERERLAALRELGLECEPLPELDDLTKLASYICEAPIALVSLLEEEHQFFGASVGVPEISSTPRDMAFCAHAIRYPDLFVVTDALGDERFAHNPLVMGPPHIRFYAGMPLITPEGHALGTLCVIDRVARALTPKQEIALRVLGRQVATQIELRRSQQRRRQAELELQSSHTRLEKRVEERTAELESARVRLELVLATANVGWWEWNLQTDRLYHSPESRAQVGYDEEEMPKNWDEWNRLIHPQDLQAATAEYERFRANPRTDFECEMRVRCRDGSIRWLLTRARLYQEGDGRPERMLGAHIDVTERRATEESLRTSREQLRALAVHLHTAREEESRRIAQELHDDLGSLLTGMKFDVGWLDRQFQRRAEGDGAEVRERLHTISEHLDGMIGRVRKVCRDLRPAVLDELGLEAALDWLAAEFETHTGHLCEVVRPEVIQLEPTRATVVFRVVQELLTNIARHAAAKRTRVEMKREPDGWHLIVTDNGRGLPKGALARRDRFGLTALRERVLAVGGAVEFTGVESGGTRVRIRLRDGGEAAPDPAQ